MTKSVYSLVLSDAVIDEIDKAAYSMNTSRSNMINQILADYVSYVTPEKRLQEIFGSVESILINMQNNFQMLLQPSDTMISMRSALAYKYNPTIKYSVELYKNNKLQEEPFKGELKVSLRTQNSQLILYIIQFFKLWAKIENSYVGQTEYIVDDGRYIRRFYISVFDQDGGRIELDNGKIGEIIAGYIQTLDTALKKYFSNLDNPAKAARETEIEYVNYLNRHKERLI